MLLQTRSRRFLLAGLLLLALAATALSPDAAAGHSAQAAALLRQTAAAHRALTNLSAIITLSPATSPGEIVAVVTLAYRKPRFAKMTLTEGDVPVARIVSNGKTVTTYFADDKVYQVSPVPPGADTIQTVFNQAQFVLPHLLSSPEMLTRMLTQPGVTAEIVPRSSGRDDTTGAVETVLVTLPASGAKPALLFVRGAAAVALVIGRADHLLRRIMITPRFAAGSGRTTMETHTETITVLSTAPLSAADFQFTPPFGVKKAPVPIFHQEKK